MIFLAVAHFFSQKKMAAKILTLNIFYKMKQPGNKTDFMICFEFAQPPAPPYHPPILDLLGVTFLKLVAFAEKSKFELN